MGLRESKCLLLDSVQIMQIIKKILFFDFESLKLVNVNETLLKAMQNMIYKHVSVITCMCCETHPCRS